MHKKSDNGFMLSPVFVEVINMPIIEAISPLLELIMILNDRTQWSPVAQQ